MYVAYRKGDKVYWTRKKVALHPGETLISDGKLQRAPGAAIAWLWPRLVLRRSWIPGGGF